LEWILCVSAITEPPRLEVFTGSGRRRRWSAEDKARIVAETIGDPARWRARNDSNVQPRFLAKILSDDFLFDVSLPSPRFKLATSARVASLDAVD
jgi:hypothetical protein